MKRSLLVMLAAALLSSCQFYKVKPVNESSTVTDPDSVLVYEVGPDTKFVTREYEINDYTYIGCDIPAVIHYSNGEPSLKVRLPEDLADLFCHNKNYQNNSTGMCPGFTRDVCIEKGHIEIWASSSGLNMVSLDGEGELVCDSTVVVKSVIFCMCGKSKLVLDSVSAGNILINARDLSECTIKSIKSDKLYCYGCGLVQATIGGSVDTTTIDVSGHGTIYLKDFTSSNITEKTKLKGRIKRL